MAAPTRTVFDLLRSLERDRLCKLDPGLALAIEEILRAGGHDTPEALAAAIASICAREPAKWPIIHARALKYLRDPDGKTSPVERIVRDAPVLAPSQIDAVAEVPKGSWGLIVRLVALVLVGLAIVGAAALMVRGPEDNPPSVVDPSTGAETGAASAATTTGSTSDTTEASTTAALLPDTTTLLPDTTAAAPDTTTAPPATTGDAPPPPPPPSPERSLDHLLVLAATLLLSFGFVVLGVRLVFAPVIRRLLAELAREDAEAKSEGLRVRYSVPRHLPFARWVVDAAAEVLARRISPDHGSTIDVPATIDATIRAGGRVIPRMEPGHAPQSLVVLVSLESKHHGVLDPVEAILDRWREMGLVFRRFDFGSQIESLEDHDDRSATTLDALARRSEGSPLLVFARSTLLVSKAGAQGWLHRLRAWPGRALVDLDPRLDAELAADDRDTRRAIERSDLRRFPFTARGLDAAARYLASGGQITVSVPPEPLPPVAAIAPQLRRWAHCLATVPDPSWAQLEEFRRRFAAGPFEGVLGDFRVIERLLEWLRADLAARDLATQIVHGSGYGINLAEEATRDYLTALWRDDRDHALEDACHEVLLDQLRAAAPAQYLDQLQRDAKMLEHEFLLAARDPARAAEALQKFDRFIGTPAERFVRAILERHAARFAAAGRGVPPGLAELDGALHRFYGRPLALAEALGDGAGWRATRIDVELGLAAAAGNIVALLGVLEGTGGWRAFLIGLGGGAGGVALAFLALRLRRLLNKQAAMEAEEAEDAEAHAPSEVQSRDAEHPLPPVDAVVEPVGVVVEPLGEPWRPGALDDPPTGRALGVRHTALEGTRAPMRFVEFTGGEFTMGSRDDDSSAYDDEKPRHRVRVGRFWMAEAPVTQAQYQALMGANPSVDKGPEVPVNKVSWEDAVRFCNALSKREGREECYREEGGGWRWDRKADGYRLPTEAEWEYACRAGTTSAYSFGDDPAALGEHAWFDENSMGDAQPVKRKRPNPWGLHDMHGNVWEWCWDWFGPYSNQPSNMPQGPDSGEGRVLRGGSFYNTARDLRSALRLRLRPSDRFRVRGFRCVRSSPSSVDR